MSGAFRGERVARPADPRGAGDALSKRVVIKVSSVALAASASEIATDAVLPPPESGPTLKRPAARISHVRIDPAAAMAQLTDRDLVDRAREGDRRAFSELVRRHQRRIHRLALHMLRDRAEAEDVTQETFVRAFNALGRFDGRSEPFTWIYRIAVNLSLNAIRSRKAQRTSAAPASDDPRLEAILRDAAGSSVDPPDAARRQLYVALAEAIDALSETLRTTLILVCVDGRSHEEASQVLGAPEGTIAWRVHEARRKLREFMSKRGFDPEGEGT